MDFLLDMVLRIWTLGILKVVGIVVFGVATIVFTILYYRRRRRWQLVSAVLCGLAALLCACVLYAMLTMMKVK